MRIRAAAGIGMQCALAIGGIVLQHNALAARQTESLGAANQNDVTHFRVYLPLTHRDALDKLLQSLTDVTSPNYHQWLTPGQFKVQFGPSRSDIAKAKHLLEDAGFKVVGENTQSLEVEGPVAAVERTFGDRIELVRLKSGHVRMAAANHLLLPQALAAMGAVIPEFAPHLLSHVHSQVLKPLANPSAGFSANPPATLLAATATPRLATQFSFYYANDLNEAYQEPSFQTEVTPLFSWKKLQVAGVGARIGIVISSIIDPKDLANSFNSKVSLGPVTDIQAYSANSNLPVPVVTIRPVDGGSGPFNPGTDDANEA